MSAESPRHARTGGPLTVASQPPSDRGLIDAVSGFINDVTLSSSSTIDPKDVIQWARFETTDINDPTPEGDSDNDISPLLLILGYGSGVQVWLIPPSGEAQEVLSWRQGTVRVLRVLPTPQHGDCFAVKRPLIALCDSASPGPSFCSLSFISIRGGEQVKSIKFKNQILDVLANKRSVVISFSERFAVFDAGTLEDRMAVTTCYPCPCPLGGSLPVNPLALGDRWLAYADKKLNPTKRSSGGCEGEGVTSYTATVLHAAKSLSKGLRGLGESVAHSLAGGRSTSQSPSPPNADIQQPGVVTILDIEGIEEEDGQDTEEPCDPIIAHFLAHSDAIIALKFDSSGLLLVTADRRGHDFHVFRINPHPCGPSLASVHHLYILHRGDTTAKVQDIAISPDSRWAAISTLRGTTHVFAVSPYGGPCGVRTHSQPRVVNRLSRFHRSAGLPIHAAASKRGSPTPVGDGLSTGSWFPNPRLPPYPLPTTAGPLAQLRPTANIPTHTITRNSSGRQRLSSLSEDSNAAPLLARARFGLATAPTSVVAGGLARPPASPVAALYLMAANGSLLHLLLHPKPLSSLPKEKICDDSPIELEVEPVAQWPLQRPPAAADLLAPLPPSNPLLQHCRTYATRCTDMCMSEEERWLSQVEIVTHAGPHRRLWMGPQFVFKTYNCTGSNSSLSEAETVEVDTSGVARSNPVNMPGVRPVVPVLVDSGSASSLEHSPSDSFRRKSLLAESGRATSVCDVQLREDLAEAMKEDHGLAREVTERPREQRTGVARAVDPQGTVVQPSPSVPPDPEPDVELYVSSNCDEATFRPVVRAPAPLATRPEAMARPLPRTTTIPVQSVPSAAAPESPPDPLPLNTAVVIPAALTAWPHSNDRNETNPSFSLDKDIITESETKNARSIECEKGSANTERERQEHESLPNSNRSSGDIQPAARPRVKKSPTPKSDCDRVADDDSSKDRKSSKGKISSRDIDRGNDLKKNAEERKQTQNPKKEKNEIVEIAPVVEPVRIDEPLKEPSPISVTEAKQSTKVEVKEAKVVQKIVEVASKAMEPITPLSVETKTTTVQETVEKGTATTIDENIKQSDATTFNKSAKSKKSTKKEKETVSSESTVKESAKEADIKTQKTEVTSTAPLKKSKKKETVEQPALIEPIAVVISKDEKQVPDEPIPAPVQTTKPMKKAPTVSKSTPTTEDEKIIEKSEVKPISSVKEPIKIEVVETKALLKIDEDDLKTEDQVWDMLLNESEKSMTVTESPMMSEKYTEDPKPKSKKSRRVKKSQEDTQEKDDDDSFVEIHAIDDKQQSCGELVSISTLFDDLEPVSIVPKVKKGRSSKSITPERKECIKTECAEYGFKNQEEFSLVTSFKNQHSSFTSRKRDDFDNEPIWGFQQYELAVHTDESVQDDNKTHNFSETVKKNAIPKTGTAKMDKLNVADITITENTTIGKESSKGKPKSKSTSPYSERKSSEKRHEIEVKDVYVIDTVNDEFPEIQITKGNKMRKKSPQPDKKTPDKEPDIKSPDIEIVEKPVKSWSSIAASKNVKKEDKVVEENILPAKETVSEIENEGSSTQVSLQEKLMELCKRTDIMVAECDMPSELNFVEEHHSVLELPPLEPLDFGLDDFKMEVMRDSLLETNDTLTSPICKINIDSILSTIRETTSKAIESSAFNLIDLEKVPLKKEKGFSVVENDKIKTQEVKIDDDKSDKEVMEKSSEDDIASPVVSTDSDKEDKKNGASNVTMPSSKQSSKSKKSRKKKK